MINRKISCPVCGHRGMVLIQSNHRPFYGCENFPACKGRRRSHPNGVPFTDAQEALENDIEKPAEQFIQQAV